MKHRHSFTALVLLATGFGTAAQEPAASSSEKSSGASSVGYPSVSEALESLKAKPGVSVTVTKPDAWLIVVEPQTYTQWSFTPAGHYAHPAVVRREIKQSDGRVFVEMRSLCQAEKTACDKLIEEFKQLNERMRQSIQGRIQSSESK